MHITLVPLVIALLAFWFYAELNWDKRARIISGFLVLVGTSLLVFAFCQVKPYYESRWHRVCIRDANDLLRKGQHDFVLSAFDAYTSIAATNSTFRAAERTMHTLEIERLRLAK